MRDLSSRLRDIVRQDSRPRPEVRSEYRPELTYIPDPDPMEPPGEAANRLGGAIVGTTGACIAIDTVYPGDRSHGRRRIESCVPWSGAPIHLFDPRLSGRSDWARRVVFFDIETTGLSGGAGTLAFLAGCGWFEPSGFRVRQFFLAGPSGEHEMLRALGEVLSSASLLVTFNGRTFDVPFMETRWAFHRAPNPTDDLLHFDMLPPARRLWSRREARDETGGSEAGGSGAGGSGNDERGCSLGALERTVLGLGRGGDGPGFEIPARYFHFLLTGEAESIRGVLEHNRTDIVSLAAIMSHALWLAQEGPDACRESEEQLAIGRLYERAGELARARQAYEAAAQSIDTDVRRRALACLAAGLRREERYDEAAEAWQEVLDLGTRGRSRMPSPLDRRAAEQLAIHHEHRKKDVDAARRYAEALGRDASGALRREVDRRMSRLNRKAEARTGMLKI